jgi:mannose-6-phosphate isomerase
MKHLIKLTNQIKTYAWGSPQWIPQLLGKRNDSGVPWAELWMGIHPEGPSTAEIPGGPPLPLPDLIAGTPDFFLGEEVKRKFGALPFLYKLLAAAKPLSVQAHPNLEQAKAGFERENQAGIALSDPVRNYKDANHQPEILCALLPFRAMCGFREPATILTLLDVFSRNAAGKSETAFLARLRSSLAGDGKATREALRDFLTAIFSLPPESRDFLSAYTREQEGALKKTQSQYAEIWETAAYFARLYPGDPAVIAPLYLNLIRLAPGEAVYLPAGVLHAYVEGLGVELMANSDNVLRGGLSPKHVDVDELTRILEFAPFTPKILQPPEGCSGIFRYPTECGEFSLTVLTGTSSLPLRKEGSSPPGRQEPILFPQAGPGIVLVTRGRVAFSFRNGEEELRLDQGESAFFAPWGKGTDLSCSGDFTLYIAGTGPSSAS